MSSYQIKNLTENSLVSFGIHTHTHPRLTSIENTTMNYELCKSRELLENVIGQKVCSLAYPHGAYNSEVTAAAESCGLTQLLTLEEQMVDTSQIKGEMGRFLMDPDVWFLEFKLTVDGAYSWLFSFRRNIRLLKKYVGA